MALAHRVSILLATACFACGASPAQESKTPWQASAVSQVMIVPADRVVERCPCDDDALDSASTARKPVEYVPVDEWQPPMAARRIESRIAPRGSAPATYVNLPKLTLHRGIPEDRVTQMGYGYGSWGRRW